MSHATIASHSCTSLYQPLDYAAEGLMWSPGFNCFIKQMGGGNYWLCAYPSAEYHKPGQILLICDEDVLMNASLTNQASLRRAVVKSHNIIGHRCELAECEDMDDLTESLGMGRMFGTVAFA